MHAEPLQEYHRLIAAGLGLLDTALKRVKMTPRVEANMRLRYAGVLHEETENSMEAETALGKGIVLCDRVCFFDIHSTHGLTFSTESLLRPEICNAIFACSDNVQEKSQSGIEGARFIYSRF